MQQVLSMKGTLLKRNDSNQWSKRICECNGPYLGLLNTKNKLVANLYLPSIIDIYIIGEVNDELGSGTLFNIKLKDEKLWCFRARSMNDAKKWTEHLKNLSKVDENSIDNNNIDPKLASKWKTPFSETIISTPLSIMDTNIDNTLSSSPPSSTTSSSSPPPPPPPPINHNNLQQSIPADILFNNIEKLVVDIDNANIQLEEKLQENIKMNELNIELKHQLEDINIILKNEIELKKSMQLQLDIKTKEFKSKDEDKTKELEQIKKDLKDKEIELVKISTLYTALKMQIDELTIRKESDDKTKETLTCKLDLKSRELVSCLQKLKILQIDLDNNKTELNKLLANFNDTQLALTNITNVKYEIEKQLDVANEKVLLLEDIVQRQVLTQASYEKKLRLIEEEKKIADYETKKQLAYFQEKLADVIHEKELLLAKNSLNEEITNDSAVNLVSYCLFHYKGIKLMFSYENNNQVKNEIDSDDEIDLIVSKKPKQQKSILKLVLILIFSLIMCCFSVFEVTTDSTSAQSQNDQQQVAAYSNKEDLFQQHDQIHQPYVVQHSTNSVSLNSEKSINRYNNNVVRSLKIGKQIENELNERKQKKGENYHIKSLKMIKNLVYIPINIFMNVFARVLQLFKI